MFKKRYFIESFPMDSGINPAIAVLAHTYHYHRIDNTFIIGVAEMGPNHLDEAWDHRSLFLFPSIHDVRPLSFWLDQQKMSEAFKEFFQKWNALDKAGKAFLLDFTDHVDIAMFELPD